MRLALIGTVALVATAACSLLVRTDDLANGASDAGISGDSAIGNDAIDSPSDALGGDSPFGDGDLGEAGDASFGRPSICDDLGDGLAFGVSSFAVASGWPEMARDAGVRWRFLYVFVDPTDPAMNDFVLGKKSIANGLEATLVLVVNDDLVGRARAKFGSGDDATLDQRALADPALMKAWYGDYLSTLATATRSLSAGKPPTMVMIEPVLWSYMMWSMKDGGTVVAGRKDPSTVPVSVASSGVVEVAAFSNDGSGFARSLLALRDLDAKDVRLAFHLPNNAGDRVDVATAFYSKVGRWDLIVTDELVLDDDRTKWWRPLSSSSAQVAKDEAWLREVSTASGLPIVLWQVELGPTDFHLFGESTGRDLVARFMDAGLAGLMWEHLGDGGSPDNFRGKSYPTPPADPDAGGTAKDLRLRLAAYLKSPLPWPSANPCGKH